MYFPKDVHVKKERERREPKKDRCGAAQLTIPDKKNQGCQQWSFIMGCVTSKRSYSKNQKDVFLLLRREKNRYKYCMWISQIKIFSITLKAQQVHLLKKKNWHMKIYSYLTILSAFSSVPYLCALRKEAQVPTLGLSLNSFASAGLSVPWFADLL